MPAGRNQVAYDDINYDAITLKADNSTNLFDATQPNGIAAATVGRACKLSAADTVALAADADHVIGKLIKLEQTNGVIWATVQHKGFCTLPGGAAAGLTLGGTIVGAVNATPAPGFVRVAVAAESPKAHHKIWNAADTAAVVVELGG